MFKKICKRKTFTFLSFSSKIFLKNKKDGDLNKLQQKLEIFFSFFCKTKTFYLKIKEKKNMITIIYDSLPYQKR